MCRKRSQVSIRLSAFSPLSPRPSALPLLERTERPSRSWRAVLPTSTFPAISSTSSSPIASPPSSNRSATPYPPSFSLFSLTARHRSRSLLLLHLPPIPLPPAPLRLPALPPPRLHGRRQLRLPRQTPPPHRRAEAVPRVPLYPRGLRAGLQRLRRAAARALLARGRGHQAVHGTPR